MVTSEQPEKKVPMTATSRSAWAYACAFDRHLKYSDVPLCALESSHD
jgi:hypothetical protein